MLVIFDSFDDNSRKLYQSLTSCDVKVPIVSLNDDGFLPQGVSSPIDYYLQQSGTVYEGKALFFNQVPVPHLWEIRGDSRQGEVFNWDKKKAHINYAHVKQERLVQSVEWYGTNQQIRVTEHYNQYGQHFARTVHDSTGRPFTKTYFNSKGQEVVVQNFFTDNIILTLNGKSKIFNSVMDFYAYFLQDSGYNLDKLYINSLGTPYFLVQALPGDIEATLFWQEGIREAIPGNMDNLLQDSNYRFKHIVVPDEPTLQWLLRERPDYANYFKKVSYIYQQLRVNQARKQVFILTNSDQIPHLEDLVQQLPDFRFSVAALTEMSAALLALNKYANVDLYPNANKARLDILWNENDIYLDINRFDEVNEAVKQAFENDMLILGFADTVHNAGLVLPENIYPQEHVQDMITKLRDLLDDSAKIKALVEKQRYSIASSSIDDYQKLF